VGAGRKLIRLSVCGVPVGVAVYHALEDARGGRDLGLGRLQDRLLAGPLQAGNAGPWPSRRSSSATRSSSRRYRSRAASSSARSIAFSASFAATTARSRASSTRCCAAPADRSGASGTSPDHAQPQRQAQAPCAVYHAGLPPVTDMGAGSQGLTQRPGLPWACEASRDPPDHGTHRCQPRGMLGRAGTPGTSRAWPGHILAALAELF
jgi:hypothetical protein